ncbi:hypothetical protein XELAEV_18036801mg [Xenopus laevis]|uniref:Uncharacterized protein n=1 Tax=Xenopus laevis TaxID=8355 RepID=A0A974CBY0_XENLA|nr:hypothetical protein XELAEV_18036801mg [Xenopus laevis]
MGISTVFAGSPRIKLLLVINPPRLPPITQIPSQVTPSHYTQPLPDPHILPKKPITFPSSITLDGRSVV